MGIAEWLRGLGLERYEAVFRENAIDLEVLPEITEPDLEKIGVLLGHRKRILRAIDVLRAGPSPASSVPEIAVDRGEQAERRQLTVMFCDMVGSTELSSRLDPEELRHFISAYHRCVAEVASRYSGFLAKYMGDGVLIYFGFPVAHEDDAERAVRAGLEITAAVSRLEAAEMRLASRVGIATGLVIVGDLDSGDVNAVLGETPNLAARLQAEAPPSGVVIAPATRRLTMDWFRYRDLGQRWLKGIPEPVVLTQVLGEKVAESRFAAVRSTLLTPFIGREQELALLTERWEKTSTGEGQVVLLSGEAGIGKSRLSEMLRERVKDAGSWIRYQCSPYYTDTALHPIIAQLTAAARIEPDDLPESKLDKLERVILPSAVERQIAFSLLADLLSIPTGKDNPPLTIGPELRKIRTLQLLSEQLVAMAARAPVLALVEDAHWIDPTTRELLESLIEPVSRLRIMLLVTCRPEFGNPWSHHANLTSLALNRLGQRQSMAIAAGAAAADIPQRLIEAVVGRADGNPLFIEELTHSVVETGLSEASGNADDMAPLVIPTTLQGSLLARLDRLGGAREVAQFGAAIGREFGYGLLAAIADRPEAKLQTALTELEAAGLVFRQGSPPEAIYTFKHALVQDAAHDSLLKSRRQQLHARIAEAIEQHYPEMASSQPQLIAQHYAEAGFGERSARAWLAAGRLAASRSASREAAMQFGRGIDVLRGMEAGAERDRLELDLQISRGSACAAAYGHGATATENSWVRAVQLLHDQSADPRHFWARRGLSSVYGARADMAAYGALAQETMDRAQQSGDPAGLCVAYMMLSNFCVYTGKFPAAEQAAVQAARYVSADFNHESFRLSGLDITIHVPIGRMNATSLRGDHPGAEQSMKEALRLAQEQPQIGVLVWALFWASFRCLIERDFERAGAFAARATKLAEEHGFGFWATAGQASQGAALVIVDPGGAIPQIVDALARLQGMITWHPHFLCFQAEALLTLGRIGEARGVIDRALALSASTGVTWWDVELHRIRAAIIRAEGRDGAAVREALTRAVAIAEQQGSGTFHRRAAADMELT